MEPTELYNRSKRNLFIFATVLALLLVGGTSAPQAGAVFYGFNARPEYIPSVLSLVVLYLLFQFFLARNFQPDTIRNRTKVDFWVTAGFSIFVLFGYLTIYLRPLIVGLSPSVWATLLLIVVTSGLAGFTLLKWSDLQKWRRETFSLRRSSLEQRLKEPGWTLNYNPQRPGKTKPISFNDDGTIGEGHNDNEHRWRLTDDRLDIYASNGELQNSFDYDAATDQFKATRPERKFAIEGQVIYRQPQ